MNFPAKHLSNLRSTHKKPMVFLKEIVRTPRSSMKRRILSQMKTRFRTYQAMIMIMKTHCVKKTRMVMRPMTELKASLRGMSLVLARTCLNHVDVLAQMKIKDLQMMKTGSAWKLRTGMFWFYLLNGLHPVCPGL